MTEMYYSICIEEKTPFCNETLVNIAENLCRNIEQEQEVKKTRNLFANLN
jgi:hypothetical protein